MHLPRLLAIVACSLLAAFASAQAPVQETVQPPPASAKQAKSAQQKFSDEHVLAGNRWGADYFPNCELLTHDGRKVRWFDDCLKDKVVLVNYIYTTCPDACPLASAKLAEVYQILKDRMGKDVFFYSISVDPEVDTPEVLAKYAARFGAGPGWSFLTGTKDDIRIVRKKMGMLRVDEEAKSDHTLDMMIGNQRKGLWLKRSTMDNPYAIAEQVANRASGWKLPPRADAQVEMPLVRNYMQGEAIFRTRCSSCHIIGADDGLPKQGPNLAGVVERRDRKWLERWIAEPDVMLALKDPLAMDLYNAWRQLPMPNLKLTPAEVQDVIGYIEGVSHTYLMELKRQQEQAAADWAMPDTVADIDEAPAAAAHMSLSGCCEKTAGLVGDAPAATGTIAAIPGKAACCEKRDGLVGDGGAPEATSEIIVLEGDQEPVVDASTKPACCQKGEGLVGDIPAESAEASDRTPTVPARPYAGLAIMLLLGVVLYGLHSAGGGDESS